jgi:retinol dehydrogenase 12
MKGKVCLVTGATAGIGLVTARELARAGATVVMVSRTRSNGEKAAATIRAETGNDAVEFMAADLSSLADVRRFAGEFLARHPRLDVLINNAGALCALRRESVDGIEMTFALNHLGPFLLTNLLLDALKAAAPCRVINVASSAHDDVPAFNFDDPEAKREGGIGAYPRSEWGSLFYSLAMPWAHPGFMQYARTKLANLLFTHELAKRLQGTGVTANALHPGVVASNFSDGNGVYGWFMRRFMNARGITPEEGAKTMIYLATSHDVASQSGGYFIECKAAQCSKAAMDAEAAAKLWSLSEAMTS